jgi:FAD/FMN-containing dehydrogenase
MLADGAIVLANASKNSDLFWAVRGGTGGNFGVVLQITYQLHSVSEYWGFGIEWPLEEHPGDINRAASVLALLQERFMRGGAPDQLGYMAFLGWQKQEPYLLMRGVYHGSKAAGEKVLAPLLKIAPNKIQIDKVGSYYEIDKYLLDAAPVLLPDVPDLAREDKQDGYIARPMSPADWRDVIDFFLKTPNQSSLLAIEPYGGAINRVEVGANAFIHRAVDMDLYFDVFWMSDAQRADAVKFLDDVMAFMQPYFNGYSYQNYPRLKQTDYRRRYWGEWFETVLAVKEKYDPGNFFSYPQSVSPEPGLAPKPVKHPLPGLAQPIDHEPYCPPDSDS